MHLPARFLEWPNCKKNNGNLFGIALWKYLFVDILYLEDKNLLQKGDCSGEWAVGALCGIPVFHPSREDWTSTSRHMSHHWDMPVLLWAQ